MQARLRLDCGEANLAQAVQTALAPELSDAPRDVTASLNADGAAVHVHLVSSSLAQLRASIQTTLRLAAMMAGTLR